LVYCSIKPGYWKKNNENGKKQAKGEEVTPVAFVLIWRKNDKLTVKIPFQDSKNTTRESF
jgi:hypothetical protein